MSYAELERLPLSKISNRDLSLYCSSDQDRADVCNDYWFWNYEAIKKYHIPLTVILAESNTGEFMAPIDRFRVLTVLIAKLKACRSVPEAFDILGDFPSLHSIVFLYGIRHLTEPGRRLLSEETVHFMVERCMYGELAFIRDLAMTSDRIRKEVMDNFPVNAVLLSRLTLPV